MNNRKLLAKVLRLGIPYKRIFIISGILAVLVAPLGSIRPYLINKMVDDHIMHNDMKGLTSIACIILILLIAESLLRYAFIFLTGKLGQSIVKDLRVRVFEKIIHFRLKFFDKTPIGNLTTRTISDIETINTVFSEGLINIIADILGLLAVLAVMTYTSIKLTLICLATIPLLLIATYFFKESVRKSYQKVRGELARMNAFLQERITGMKIVQIFSAEKQEGAKFKDINYKYTKANIDGVMAYALFFPAVEIISAISLGLMVWWGARGVLDNSITLGALIAFPIYVNMLFRPIRMLADKFNTLQMGLVAADRVFDTLDRDEHIPDTGKITKQRFNGDVEFKNVYFSYEEGNPTLHDVSFKVNAGDTMAIVGSTGSGKTTIISLLSRLYDIDEGQILIDGIDARELTLGTLRSRIAVVLQDVFLFSGTIYENITLYNRDISLEKVKEAARQIKVHDFIEALPGGYDFKVSERGSNLSTGQRQCISFVRALVFDPDILILDEATSSVDMQTEALIQNAIETLITKCTSIIIAHRLSTIRHADNILVMSQGQVLEYGTHQTLMEIEEGRYKYLFDMQMKESLVED